MDNVLTICSFDSFNSIPKKCFVLKFYNSITTYRLKHNFQNYIKTLYNVMLMIGDMLRTSEIPAFLKRLRARCPA